METTKRQMYVDYLADEHGYDARVTPWGIYIEYPNFDDNGSAVVKWRVSEHELASLNGIRMPRGFTGGQQYAFSELAAALHAFTGTRGTMHGASMRIEIDN
ncbi:UNVERIFIED_CONTAM: hypothetical protein Q9R71_16750 [Actinomycetes bacterium ARC8]|nr:hypothetical protein [Actinomycetes bacterium ARC8]